MEIAPNLHRIGNDIVAAYLVTTPEGITVIDAALPGHWSDLLAELKAMGRPIEDIKGVILTHGDSDHIGFAERLRRDYGVPVYVHPEDADRAKGGPVPKNTMGPWKLGAMLGFGAYALRKGMGAKHLTATVNALPGTTLDLPGAPQIIGMPGHSAGSIAIYVPRVDAVFVGDALTTRNVLTGVVGAAPAPFTDEPALAISSLQALVPTGAKWVLPGHGPVWGGGVVAAVEGVEKAAVSK